jgi:L-cystine uptake protein TcyP (sodium:dicarboxylate symporter family)
MALGSPPLPSHDFTTSKSSSVIAVVISSVAVPFSIAAASGEDSAEQSVLQRFDSARAQGAAEAA